MINSVESGTEIEHAQQSNLPSVHSRQYITTNADDDDDDGDDDNDDDDDDDDDEGDW